MGVPKFYRWVSERYPNISRIINDNQIPDFDNFYLDMNGIIHACSHINDDNCEIIVTEEEIFRNIFNYLDFLFRMIKPKKVFFMAIDGVAPRAKMNQQRARRFRAGKERIKKLKMLAEKSNQTFQETAAKHFDTNAITPGTQFMVNLHEQLKFFIHVKLTTDPLWENVDVHLSGHLTPGEGEHKIMDYIRYTRSQPGYNVNTRHCLYGLDADLIMLGLITHEMHFALLREEVKFGSKKISKILAPEEIIWQVLHISLLRDYIDLEFRTIRNQLKFSYNLDNIIDDCILMCYLVGNDFIPHLPHFHINEDALIILWDTYKKILPTFDGYMNESGELNLIRFEAYISELAKLEFERYSSENDKFKNLEKLDQSKKPKSQKQDDDFGFNFAALDKLNDQKTTTIETQKSSSESSSLSDDNENSSDSDEHSDKSNNDKNEKQSFLTVNQDDIDNMPLIQAEFRQYKNHYYRDKMRIDLTSSSQLQIYVEQYIEALQWILKYYYQGCASWSWFYPQHYAPYISDLKNFKHLNIKFQKGVPFKPYEQLLSVLPPTSCDLLPICLQSLMKDPQSSLLHFYPENFELDQNEKKKDWEAIVLLPFIDEELLLNTITKHYSQLNSNEQKRNQYYPSLCFKTTSTLHPIGNSLEPNPYFPLLKETRASYKEIPIDYYHIENSQLKHGRFEEKDMINYPKFPILNVLPYKFGYKTNAVSLFETRSREATLVLNLISQSDSDCITYNKDWKPKGENLSLPFQIINQQLLIERYLGKCIFVNWPHFQYGIVCAISDYKNLYTWSNIPGGSYFSFEKLPYEQRLDYKNFIQTPLYVSYTSFEISSSDRTKSTYIIYPFDEIQTQIEYTKALNINRYYENRQGISIGPIPILLYVSPLIGYRTIFTSKSDKSHISMCFSNQALAYPLQTTLFKLPNYKYDIDNIPQTIKDYFKLNEPIFGLERPYYSSLGYIEQINRDNHGKYFISCRMEASEQVNQPDIHHLKSKLDEHKLKYFTADDIADRLKTSAVVISKITGKINIIGENKRNRKANPTNIGLSWKFNKPVKLIHGYTKKIDQVWYYSEPAILIISDYITKFPEIVAEIQRKPRDDNYHESKIWPTQDGRSQVQQIRQWMKSLPTYSIPLTDSSWEILDTPIINEIEKSVQSFYKKQLSKNNPSKKAKLIHFEPHQIFKPTESLGLCNPDNTTEFFLHDRVINVRLGTGIPIGTRGTVVGIMRGRTNLDTYYDILFDNLPLNSLHTILLGKNQQKCRVKVHSYHLLNYSHSLRSRSMNNQQRFIPSVSAWEQRSSGQTSNSRQQQQQQQTNQNLKKNSDDNNNTKVKPKSAPPLTTNDKPNFNQDKEEKLIINNSLSNEIPIQSSISTENPPIEKNLSDPKIISSTTLPSNIPEEHLIFRAMQDFEQIPNTLQQSTETIQPTLYQNFNPPMFTQQSWPLPSQYFPNQFINESTENMPQVPMYPFEPQSPMYMPFGPQQPLVYPHFQPGMEQINPMSPGPMVFYDYNTGFPISPYDLPPINPMANYSVDPTINPMPMNYQQQSPQLPMQMTNIPPYNPYHSPPPLQHPQMASSHQTNRQTLQFIPSQVFRNMSKKS